MSVFKKVLLGFLVLISGGLIRSMGGWSAVLASRRRGESEASDQRILGDGDFVKQVVSGLDDLVKRI